QFGDNDSGRFIKLSPVGCFISNKDAEEKYLNLKGYNELIYRAYNETEKDLYWDENNLDHRTLISCFSGLFDNEIFNCEFPLEKSFISCISNRNKLTIANESYIYKENIIKESRNKNFNIQNLAFENEIIYEFEENIENNLCFIIYPESGIYIFKNKIFFLAICATPLGQNNYGGHTHNDKLSYELYYDGNKIQKDPGTYLYTAIIEKRNLFRSTIAHNVPIIDESGLIWA
ncbi:MAG: heparinase II/III family protein, partial [candidate division WOR-3 bacterium]